MNRNLPSGPKITFPHIGEILSSLYYLSCNNRDFCRVVCSTSQVCCNLQTNINRLFIFFTSFLQIQQVFRRMFPFGRGLCHAYWAPNFWVFYIMLDKVFAFLLVKLGFYIEAPKASFTGGLVGDSLPFSVLPTVKCLAYPVIMCCKFFPIPKYFFLTD